MPTRQSATHIVDNISLLTIIITDKSKWKTEPVNCYKIINNPIPTRSEAIKWQIHFGKRPKSEIYFFRRIIKKAKKGVSTDAFWSNNRCQKCNQTFFHQKRPLLITFQIFSEEIRTTWCCLELQKSNFFVSQISISCYFSPFLWL